MSFKELKELWRLIEDNFYSVKGLCFLWVAAVLLLEFLRSRIGQYVTDTIQLSGKSIPPELIGPSYLAFMIVVLVGVFVFWQWKRAVPSFGESELGILFAPNFDESLEDDVKRLFEALQHEIKRAQFANRFTIKRLPPNRKIHCDEEALQILKQSKAMTTIWGRFESESIGAEKVARFPEISFTVMYIRHLDLQDAVFPLIGKSQAIKPRSEIADRSILAKDISWVVQRLIGASLLNRRQFADAVRVFRPLAKQLEFAIKKANCSAPMQAFAHRINCDLANALLSEIGERYAKYLDDDRLFQIPGDELDSFVAKAEQASKLNPDSPRAFLELAIFRFLKGQIDAAIAAARAGAQRAAAKESIPNLSLAFLYNFKGDFRSSDKEYGRGLQKPSSFDEDMIRQCLFFIRQSIERFPSKPQLRVAFAVLVIARGEKSIGIDELKTFLDETRGQKHLRLFQRYAKRVVKEFQTRST